MIAAPMRSQYMLAAFAYLFFDPAKSGGYVGVALYCAAILLLFLLLSWLAVASANRIRGSDHVSAVHL
jgi:hypothetical protein